MKALTLLQKKILVWGLNRKQGGNPTFTIAEILIEVCGISKSLNCYNKSLWSNSRKSNPHADGTSPAARKMRNAVHKSFKRLKKYGLIKYVNKSYELMPAGYDLARALLAAGVKNSELIKSPEKNLPTSLRDEGGKIRGKTNLPDIIREDLIPEIETTTERIFTDLRQNYGLAELLKLVYLIGNHSGNWNIGKEFNMSPLRVSFLSENIAEFMKLILQEDHVEQKRKGKTGLLSESTAGKQVKVIIDNAEIYSNVVNN
jgi:hypothetical protein